MCGEGNTVNMEVEGRSGVKDCAKLWLRKKLGRRRKQEDRRMGEQSSWEIGRSGGQTNGSGNGDND